MLWYSNTLIQVRGRNTKAGCKRCLNESKRRYPWRWGSSHFLDIRAIKLIHNTSHINQIMIKGIFQITSPFPSRISSVFLFQEETPAGVLHPPQHHYYIFTLTPQCLLTIDCIKDHDRNILFFFLPFVSIHHKYEPDEMDDIHQQPMHPRGTKGLSQVSHCEY